MTASRSSLGDSARGPYAAISAGSSTIPGMGPAVRAAAPDAARQIIEIAAQRYHLEERVLSLKGGNVVSADGGSWPLEEVTGLLDDAQILGKGARGPNPTGMRVLTFGVQVAEVAVDIETGEVRVDKIVAIHDVGRVINPLGAASQVEGGIIQGLGHTLSEQRLIDPQTGAMLNQTLDAYKMPTIADVPEIVTELIDIPDEHLTNLGAKGLGEPPIIPTAAAIANAIRDATGADIRSLPITREEMLRALAKRRRRRRSSVELLRPSSLEELEAGARASARRRDGRRPDHPEPADRHRHAGRHPLARPPRGRRDEDRRRARLWPSSRSTRRSRHALREACASAASPQLRAMGTIGGNLRQATRCWYWRMGFPCYLHGGDRCYAWTASTASTRCSATTGRRRRTLGPGGGAARARRARADEPARAADRRDLPAAEQDNRDVVALDYDEVILDLDVPSPTRAPT